jgi:hypothetical protein
MAAGAMWEIAVKEGSWLDAGLLLSAGRWQPRFGKLKERIHGRPWVSKGRRASTHLVGWPRRQAGNVGGELGSL